MPKKAGRHEPQEPLREEVSGFYVTMIGLLEEALAEHTFASPDGRQQETWTGYTSDTSEFHTAPDTFTFGVTFFTDPLAAMRRARSVLAEHILTLQATLAGYDNDIGILATGNEVRSETMKFAVNPEQPYTQVSATETPHTQQETIAEYDAVEVGGYVHWFDGWNHPEGTAQWASEWTPTAFGRLNERERLMVVAVPEQVNENGIDSHGGLSLLSIHRWTEHLYRPAGQKLGEFPLPALDEMREEYSVATIASTGIRYRRPVEEFIAETIQRREAEQAFDRAAASQLDEENDW